MLANTMERSQKRRRTEYEIDNYRPPSVYDTNNSVFRIGNEIHFSCGVDEGSIQEIIRHIANIIQEHTTKSKSTHEKLEIVYIVDSPGGSVSAILKFVDFLSLVREKHKFVEFVSIISGTAASAGTIMAIVADKRFITKNAYAMVHELSAGNRSKYTFLKSYMNYLSMLHNNLVDIYCKATQKPRAEIEDLLNKETWLSAEEYKKYGFVHDIK